MADRLGTVGCLAPAPLFESVPFKTQAGGEASAVGPIGGTWPRSHVAPGQDAFHTRREVAEALGWKPDATKNSRLAALPARICRACIVMGKESGSDRATDFTLDRTFPMGREHDKKESHDVPK